MKIFKQKFYNLDGIISEIEIEDDCQKDIFEKPSAGENFHPVQLKRMKELSEDKSITCEIHHANGKVYEVDIDCFAKELVYKEPDFEKLKIKPHFLQKLKDMGLLDENNKLIGIENL